MTDTRNHFAQPEDPETPSPIDIEAGAKDILRLIEQLETQAKNELLLPKDVELAERKVGSALKKIERWKRILAKRESRLRKLKKEAEALSEVMLAKREGIAALVGEMLVADVASEEGKEWFADGEYEELEFLKRELESSSLHPSSLLWTLKSLEDILVARLLFNDVKNNPIDVSDLTWEAFEEREPEPVTASHTVEEFNDQLDQQAESVQSSMDLIPRKSHVKPEERNNTNPPLDPIQIRWLIRRDLPEVLAIEEGSFEYAWNEEDFLCCLRQRNCIGMVAEHEHEIVGFMIYELHKIRLRLLNMAVSPESRERKVGAAMVQRLIEKLSQQRRKILETTVRETNVRAQHFFASQGLVADALLKHHYEDTDEDAVHMAINIDPNSKNRFSEHDFNDGTAA